MATEKIKRITIWVIFAFVLYAIFTNPNKSADIVHNIWDLLATGVHSIGDFFKAILGS